MSKETFKKWIEEYEFYLINGKFTCFTCKAEREGQTSLALVKEVDGVELLLCQECVKLGVDRVYSKLNYKPQ